MKRMAFVFLLLMSGSALAQYYYNRFPVYPQTRFISYAAAPAMCNYSRSFPSWRRVCGIQTRLVSGCGFVPNYYGGGSYQCGTAPVSGTICAWHLGIQTQTIVQPCGFYR